MWQACHIRSEVGGGRGKVGRAGAAGQRNAGRGSGERGEWGQGGARGEGGVGSERNVPKCSQSKQTNKNQSGHSIFKKYIYEIVNVS